MRKTLFSGILISTFLSVVSAADTRNFQQVFAPILATTHFAEISISPNGERVVWVESKVKSDTEYANTVYVTSLTSRALSRKVGPGDPRAQLGTSSVSWSPDSLKFAYIVETNPQSSEMRIAAADGSRSRSLIAVNAFLHTPRWSPDGQTIAVLYSASDGPINQNALVTSVGKNYAHQRIALIDIKSGNIRFLTAPDLFVYEYDWSPDSKKVVVTAAPCCDDKKGTGENNWWTAELYQLPIRSGVPVLLFKPQWQIASPKWSPDGSRIAFIGGLMSDFIAPGGDLFAISARESPPRNVTPGLKASVTWLAWTSEKEILTTQIVDGEGAITRVHVDEATSETLWRDAEGPYGGGLMFALSLARDGRTAAVVKQSFAHAPEVWAGPVGQWRQVSTSNSDVKPEFGKFESVHWTSDGMRVQGWLLYPRDFAPGRKYPLVVSVHGGPAAAALLHWPAAFDNIGVLSALGYFVLYPNPRGSFGQGEPFTQGNVKDLGYGDLRDIEAGVKYAMENLPIDPHRVGITGWSYGGYMAMWAITQTDLFRASVAGPGVSDWESYYGQTEIEKWLIPYFGTSAYDDPELYAKSSPIRFAKNARAATLFYVGKEDTVCPAPQSFQLWRALQHFGVETELLLYSGEGHGISLPGDQRDVTERTVRWFDEHLK